MSEVIKPNIKGATSGIFGHVDFINEEGIGGWIIDLDKPDEPQVVELYINKQKCAETSAIIPRPDISHIIGKEVKCGFLIKWKDVLVSPLLNSDKIDISIVHRESGRKLAGKFGKFSVLRKATDIGVEKIELEYKEIGPNIQAKSGVYGHVDYIDDNGIGGWLLDFSCSEPYKIEVYLGKRKIAEKLTSLPREDIGNIIGRPTNCGFHIGFEDLRIESLQDIHDILQKKYEIKVTYKNIPISSNPVSSRFYEKLRAILEEYEIIKNLVDEAYYREKYPEVAASGIDPVYHFIVYGWKNRFNPNEYFNVEYYLTVYPDIDKVGINPLRHYAEAGFKEGRNPSENFNTFMYLKANPDIKSIGLNPLEHYIRYGKKEGRKLFPIEEQAYIHNYFLNTLNTEASNNYCPYVEDVSLENIDLPVKLIALYLPQFHPIPENDEWWGKGFTEWTNVTKAQPKFLGHYQPHLPIHLGFYDLRLKENIKEQVRLAKKYGIYGFCIYYYYFGTKTLLETPIKIIYENKDIDINYCIYWANENWTRRWDGLEKEVLIHQVHTQETDRNFIHQIIPYLLDERYIKIEQRPIIFVYRVDKLSEPSKTVEYWKDFCIKNGLKEPYLVAVQSFGFKDNPNKYGFDASMEYMHSWHGSPPSRNDVATFLDFSFRGVIYDYYDLVKRRMEIIDSMDELQYEIFHEVVPSWDNTARRRKEPVIFHGSNPYIYKKWLEKAISNTIKYKQPEKRIVFIDAWNEWAEGNHLEPDRKFGYGYLQATAEAIASFMDADIISRHFYTPPKQYKNRVFYESIDKGSIERRSDILVIVHMYYTELYEEFLRYLRNIKQDYDIFFSIPVDVVFDLDRIFKEYKNPYVFRTINRGRDIYPTIEILRAVEHLDYPVGLKFHSKKSLHRWDGDLWRISSLDCLLGTELNAEKCIELIKNNGSAGLIVPEGQCVSTEYYMGSNKAWLEKLSNMAGIDWKRDEDFSFPAGSFYWFKPKLFQIITSLNIGLEDFEPEYYQMDGCLHHAIERFVGLCTKKLNFDVYEIDKKGSIVKAKVEKYYRFAKPEKVR